MDAGSRLAFGRESIPSPMATGMYRSSSAGARSGVGDLVDCWQCNGGICLMIKVTSWFTTRRADSAASEALPHSYRCPIEEPDPRVVF